MYFTKHPDVIDVQHSGKIDIYIRTRMIYENNFREIVKVKIVHVVQAVHDEQNRNGKENEDETKFKFGDKYRQVYMRRVTTP